MSEQAWLSTRKAIDPMPCPSSVTPQGFELPMGPSREYPVDVP